MLNNGPQKEIFEKHLTKNICNIFPRNPSCTLVNLYFRQQGTFKVLFCSF